METKTLMGLIIAIICIAIFWVAYDKTFHLRVNQEHENARNVIDGVTAKLNVLKEGESTEHAVQGFVNSEKWYIVGFSSDKTVNEKPKQCLLENCLCICKQSSDNIVNDCNTAGFCREIKDNGVWVYAEVFRDYTIYSSKVLGEDYIGPPESKSVYDCIPLKGNLLSIGLKKASDRLVVSTEYGPISENEYKKNDPQKLFEDYCNKIF